MSINEGLWSARMANGDVRSGTLDQLSEAFRAGHIGEGTLVRAEGSENWIKLSDVLGGAAAFATQAAAAVPSPSGPAPAPASVMPLSVPPPSAPVPAAVVPMSAPRPSAPPPTAVAPPAVVASPAPQRALLQTNGATEPWQVRLPSGEVRSGTRHQLEEAFRAGHLDQNALVLQPGTREWVAVGILLRPTQPPPAPVPPAAYLAAPAAPPRPASAPPLPSSPPPSARVDGTGELWQLRLANGQVRSGTRQQLEEAFAAGHLDEAAMVLPAGASQWVALGIVLDRRPPAPLAIAPVVQAESARVVPAELAPASAEPPSAVATQSAPQIAPSAELAASPEVATSPEAAHSPEAETSSDGWPSPNDEESKEDLWQVRLTRKQLEEAFHARLLDDDTQVLVSGANEWVPLSEVRRALPPPFGSALAQPKTHDPESAAHPEPASRTEPWPATLTATVPTPAGD